MTDDSTNVGLPAVVDRALVTTAAAMAARLAQKLLPAKAAIDVPLALAMVGLGIAIVLAPSSVPGLTPPM